jgi:hypothetical protein
MWIAHEYLLQCFKDEMVNGKCTCCHQCSGGRSLLIWHSGFLASLGKGNFVVYKPFMIINHLPATS